jgi:hypothetical protein
MTMKSQILTSTSPLPLAMLQEIANAGALDEISNHPGSVRHHMYWRCGREKETNRLRQAVMFFVYQTGRHGPQNGFRFVVVHQGYWVGSPTKDKRERKGEGGNINGNEKVEESDKRGEEDEGEGDEIDRIERPIPQGHMEVVIMGTEMTPVAIDEEEVDRDVDVGEKSDL